MCSKDNFCCDSAKFDAWFSYFYQVLEYAFAEIEDIGVAPDAARRTPASFILRPGCLRLQAGSIAVALAGGVVAVSWCCLLLAHCLL